MILQVSTRALLLLALLAPHAGAAGPAAPSGPAERLAASLRFETVSHQDPSAFRGAPFLAYHAFLVGSYPAAHRALRREVVSDYSLLYTWQGRDPARPAILLTSHLDVVPVPAEQLGDWEHPPFSGEIADGYVWGRGAIDDKVGVTCMLEAAERLAAEGFQPEATVYLAFGHDEELGGNDGAAGITALLGERGVRLDYTIDEGMALVDGSLFGLDGTLALIGIAEKGYLTLRLIARAPGGHSSMPPPSTAIGQLARAIERVEESPLPSRMDGPVGQMFDSLAVTVPFPRSFLFGQRWLTGPLLVGFLESSPPTNAMVRTTTAVTMIESGVKENVLPSSATATVNFRLAPGDSQESVIEHVRAAIADDAIEIETVQGRDASPVADIGSRSYRVLVDALEATRPGTAVAPALVLGGTDTRHYGELAENSYRFTPMLLGPDDVSRIHGKNERISVEELDHVIAFYVELLRAAGR